MNRRSLVLVALGVAELGFGTTASAQHRRHRHHGGGEEAPATPAVAAPATTTSPAAPPPPAPDPEDAEYQPAIEAANRGQREEALAMFRAIFERTHAPRAQARMGTTEIQLGRWLAAEEHLQGALAASQDAWITAHRTPLMDALGRVQQNLADLEVVCPIEGAALSVNGQPAGTFPLARPVRVVRGNVTIDVRAAGHEPARQLVVIASANARAEVTLTPRILAPVVENTRATPVEVTRTTMEPPVRTATARGPEVARPPTRSLRSGRFRIGFDAGAGLGLFDVVDPHLLLTLSLRLGWQFSDRVAVYYQGDALTEFGDVLLLGNSVVAEWHFSDLISASIGPSISYYSLSGNCHSAFSSDRGYYTDCAMSGINGGFVVSLDFTFMPESTRRSSRRYGLRMGLSSRTYLGGVATEALDLHVGYEWF